MKTNSRDGLLFEGKNPVEVAKYYFKNQPEILDRLTARDNLLLRKLASLDVEYDPAKFEAGKIFPWLVTLWKKGDPELLNLLKSPPSSPETAKFRNAQQLFAKPAFRKSIGVTDINKFGSLTDFLKKVTGSFIEKDEIPESPRFTAKEINDDIRDGNIAKTSLSNDTYLVITPLKKKGACKYGNVHMATDGGRWCTAKEADNAFDSYKDGTLYIFMDRKDGYKSKYQLYYNGGKMEFKDESNSNFDYEAFFDRNTDIFDSLFPATAQALKTMGDGKNAEISGFQSIYKMMPKAYKEIFRRNAAKFASGLLKSLLSAAKGELEDTSAIDNEETIGMDYDGITFHEDGFTVDFDLDEISSSLSSWYWVYKNGYDAYEFDSYEYDYMQLYVPEEKKQELIELIQVFEPEFNEEKFGVEGALYRAMTRDDSKKYFEDLLDHFATNLENAVNNGQSAFVDNKVENLPFTIYSDGLSIPYDRFTAYALENSIQGDTLKDMVEHILDRERIDDDNLYNHWETADVDYGKLKKQMSEDIDSARSEIEDDMDDMETYKGNREKYEKYVKDLGFTRDLGNSFRKKTEFAYMVIGRPDFEKGTVYMDYTDLKNDKKRHKGDIQIDSLPKYATMQMMFESVRKLVRDILSDSI